MGGSASPKNLGRKAKKGLKKLGREGKRVAKDVAEGLGQAVREGTEDIVGKKAGKALGQVTSGTGKLLALDIEGAGKETMGAIGSTASIFAGEEEEEGLEEFAPAAGETDIAEEPTYAPTQTKFTGEEGVQGPLNPGKKKKRGRAALLG